MKSAVIIYHKNALNYYEHRWLIKCLDSIEQQTYTKYDIFEVAYGSDIKNEVSIIQYFNKLTDKKLFFFKNEMKDHSYAMNFLINKVFKTGSSYEYCFNINIDDYYNPQRFERQIGIIEKLKYDVVSSQMFYINENDEIINKIDKLAFTFKKNQSITKQIIEEQKYIRKEFNKNHNIIAHPCVCFTRNFWEKIGPYKNIVPREDLDIFKRAINSRIKTHISKSFLLYYRIHTNQTVSKERVNPKYLKKINSLFK